MTDVQREEAWAREKTWAREEAWAKVNLYLHVTGRRPDGYHLIDSLFVFAGAHDVIEGSLSKALTVEVSGPGAKALGGGETLVHRAAEMLRAKTGITLGAELRLIKNLPVAAGLGGEVVVSWFG